MMALSKIRSDSMTDVAIQSNRNLVINGAMQVAQRGTSFSGQGGNGGPYFTDRWYCYSGGASAGRFTATQEAITDLSGFTTALKLDCTTADTSIGADEQLSLIQAVEAQNLQHLKFGTSDAVQLTYSFYAKANAAKTYIAELYAPDVSAKSQSHAFNVTTSWQRFEITFSATGANAVTINNDNGVGLYVNINLHAGSNLTSGTINSTWAAATQANRMVGCGSFYSSTDNTFFMTGAQLEIGNLASPFEHDADIGTTLAKCQRYLYRRNFEIYDVVCQGAALGNKGSYCLHLPVAMRAKPACSQGSGIYCWYNQPGSITTQTGLAVTYMGANDTNMTQAFIRADDNSTAASATNYPLGLTSYDSSGTNSTFIQLDAEL
tara:strand:- start:1927 stop:3057 length:1131 start_codon:yes stop_codon:yes gene_type:complete